MILLPALTNSPKKSFRNAHAMAGAKKVASAAAKWALKNPMAAMTIASTAISVPGMVKNLMEKPPEADVEKGDPDIDALLDASPVKAKDKSAGGLRRPNYYI